MAKYHQLIFIDDSGDPGFKFNRGSSRYFVIACVIFDNKKDSEIVSQKLGTLKQEMAWIKTREFKFHRANDRQKDLFFNSIKHLPFKVRAIVVDKSKVIETRMSQHSFYLQTIIYVLDQYVDMNKAQIYLDGRGNRTFQKQSSAAIRKILNTNRQRMNEFRFLNSRNNILIQMADMIAGAIAAKYDSNKRLRKDYTKIIQSHIDKIDTNK